MRVQPIDQDTAAMVIQSKPPQPPATITSAMPTAKSRLKRLFERQFTSVMRISPAPAISAGDGEPSSVCLDKMVRSFIEETADKPGPPARCGRSRCNCFHRGCDDSDDDDLDLFSTSDPPTSSSASDAADVIKGLVPCTSLTERNLLADVATMLDKHKATTKRKPDLIALVVASLVSSGHDAAICKSKWDKTAAYPAGEYEYIDIVHSTEGRILIDVEFRSEFEVARPTKSYRCMLQSLPLIFVGKEDRLHNIVSAVSEAARLSLKKKGLHFPPWRKPEYMRAKWLSPCCERRTMEKEVSPLSVRDQEGDVGEPVVVKLELTPVKVGKKKAVVTGLAFMLRDKT